MHFLKRVGRFVCGGSDGNVHVVEAFEEYVRGRQAGRDERVGPVMISAGKTLAQIGKGRYRTPEGLVLATEAAEAP